VAILVTLVEEAVASSVEEATKVSALVEEANIFLDKVEIMLKIRLAGTLINTIYKDLVLMPESWELSTLKIQSMGDTYTPKKQNKVLSNKCKSMRMSYEIIERLRELIL